MGMAFGGLGHPGCRHSRLHQPRHQGGIDGMVPLAGRCWNPACGSAAGTPTAKDHAIATLGSFPSDHSRRLSAASNQRNLVRSNRPRLALDGGDLRDSPVSKAQLNAFMVKVSADPALKARVDAAADAAAVVAIAHGEGHSFSAASWSRHLRG